MLGGFKWHSNRGDGGADGRPCDPGSPRGPIEQAEGHTEAVTEPFSVYGPSCPLAPNWTPDATLVFGLELNLEPSILPNNENGIQI